MRGAILAGLGIVLAGPAALAQQASVQTSRQARPVVEQPASVSAPLAGVEADRPPRAGYVRDTFSGPLSTTTPFNGNNPAFQRFQPPPTFPGFQSFETFPGGGRR